MANPYIEAARSAHLTTSRGGGETDAGLPRGSNYDAGAEDLLGLSALAATATTLATYPIVKNNLEYGETWLGLANTANTITRISDTYNVAKTTYGLAHPDKMGEDVWGETFDPGNMAENAMSTSMLFTPAMPFWVLNELTRSDDEGEEFGTVPVLKQFRRWMHERGEGISNQEWAGSVSDMGRDIHKGVVAKPWGMDNPVGEFFLNLAAIPLGAVEGSAGIVKAVSKKVDEKVFRGWLPGGSSPEDVREGDVSGALSDSVKGAVKTGWWKPIKTLLTGRVEPKMPDEPSYPDVPSEQPDLVGSEKEFELKEVMKNYGTFEKETEGMPPEELYKDTGFTVGAMETGFDIEIKELTEALTHTVEVSDSAKVLNEKFVRDDAFYNSLEAMDTLAIDLESVHTYGDLDQLSFEIRNAQEENPILNDLDTDIELAEARIEQEMTDLRKTMWDTNSYEGEYRGSYDLAYESVSNREWWENAKAHPSDQMNGAAVMVQTFKQGYDVGSYSSSSRTNIYRGLVFDPESNDWVQVPRTEMFQNWFVEEWEKYEAGEPNAIKDWMNTTVLPEGALGSGPMGHGKFDLEIPSELIRLHGRREIERWLRAYATTESMALFDGLGSLGMYSDFVQVLNSVAINSSYMKDLEAQIPAMAGAGETLSPGLTDFRAAASNIGLSPTQLNFLTGAEDSQWLYEALMDTGQASQYFQTFLDNWDSELDTMTPYGESLFDGMEQLTGTQQLRMFSEGVFGTDLTMSTEAYFNYMVDVEGLSVDAANKILSDAAGTPIETLYNADGSIKGDLIAWSDYEPTLIPEGTFAGYDEEGKAVSTNAPEWNPKDTQTWKRVVQPPPNYTHDLSELPPGGWPDLMYRDRAKSQMLVYIGGTTNKFIGEPGKNDNPAPEGTYYDPTTNESVYIPPGDLAYYYGEGLKSGAGVAGEFTETEFDPAAWTASNPGELLPAEAYLPGFVAPDVTDYTTVRDDLEGLVPDNVMDAGNPGYYENTNYLNDIGNLDLDLNTQIQIEYEVNSFINDLYSGF